jgi:hypothetical protein
MHANCEHVLQGVPVNFKEPAQWFCSFFIFDTLLIIPTRACIVRMRQLQVLFTNRMHTLNAMDLSFGVCLTRDRMNHRNICQTSSVTAQWLRIRLLRKMQHIFSYRTSWEIHSPKMLGDIFNQCNAELSAFHRSI